jgi:hypothetical protein
MATTDLSPDRPNNDPACDYWGDCEASDEDEAAGVLEAMCMHCGGWRYRNHPVSGNWGTWTDDIAPESVRAARQGRLNFMKVTLKDE